MTAPQATPTALDGVRVVDLSRVLAGPYCTQLLGDHGAEVIKIEPPDGDGTRQWGKSYDNGVSAYYAGLNRNKQHVSINLADERGQSILLRLLETADVVVENFKPGTMEKWGLGADTLLERFPNLIYCRISAFGVDGPLGGLPGYDAVLQAYSGMMDMNGLPGGSPLRIPMPITDLTTGMLAFSGVLLALLERKVSGRGQLVDLSLLDSALSLMHPAAANFFLTGDRPQRLGTQHPNIAPCDNFVTSTGEFLYVYAGTDRQFRVLCDYLGEPQIADDPRFLTNADRLVHRDSLTEMLSELIVQLDFGPEMARSMMEKGIPAGLVQSIGTVVDDPQVAHREMVTVSDGIKMLGIPIKLGRTPGTVRTAPNTLGADTLATLRDLGLTESEINVLVDENVAVLNSCAYVQKD